MITEKQNDLVFQVVAEIDTMIEERTGKDLPEFALHGLQARLIKLGKDFQRAAHSGPKTRRNNGWPRGLPDYPEEEDVRPDGRPA
jgi:hypothetical protein